VAISIYHRQGYLDWEQQQLGHHRRVAFYHGEADWKKIIETEVSAEKHRQVSTIAAHELVRSAFHEEKRQILILGMSCQYHEIPTYIQDD
jgi:hypothetical protein